MENLNKIFQKLAGSDIGNVFYAFARYADGRKKFLYLSENVEHIVDVPLQEILDDYTKIYSFVKIEDIQGMMKIQEESFQNLTPFYYEMELTKRNGGRYWISIKGIPERSEDGTVTWYGVKTDITNLRKQVRKNEKMNAELQLLNTVNDIILSCDDEVALFAKICTCLVEMGHYRLAWIAQMPETNADDQTVIMLHQVGAAEYMLKVHLDLNDPEIRKGPTAQALITKQAVITNNVTTSEYFTPWLELAKQNNIAASAVLPFQVHDTMYALNVYSSQFDAFKDHERMVLDRIARNLALGLEKINNNAINEKLNFILNERVKELRTLSHIQEVFQSEYYIEDCLQRIAQLIPAGMQYPYWTKAEIEYEGVVYSAGNAKPALQTMTKSIELANASQIEIRVSYTEDCKEGVDLSFFPEEHGLLTNILRGIKLFANELLLIENLKKTQSNLNAIFDNTDVGYVLLELNGDIVSFNQRYIEMTSILTGIPFVKGMNLLDVLTHERFQIFHETFQSVVSNRKSLSYESVYPLNNEKEYIVLTISPVMDGNELINICVTIKDITELKRSELESKRMTNDLILRNRDLEQFSFMVSHNLRAPVVNLIGLCGHLNDDLDDKEYDYIVESLNSSTERIVHVIDDLNTILMVKKDSHSVLEKVDLEKVLGDLVLYFNKVEDRQKPQIEVDVSAEKYIHSSAPFIESILYNLVGNAIKYSKKGEQPQIKVWSEVVDQDLHIHVRDQGIGIDLNKNGNKLFQLYTQLNSDVKGKGLGLYMVKTQVQMLNGKIFVKSELGKGSEFIVVMPLREKQLFD